MRHRPAIQITGNDQTRTVFKCQFADFIVIQTERLLIYAICHKIIKQAGCIHRAAMRQVTAIGKAHAKYRVTRF